MHARFVGTAVLLIVSLVASHLSGCASVRYEDIDGIPDVQEGKGLVLFYRKSAVGGSALTYQLHDGTELIGVLRSGSFFYRHSEPGRHTYKAQTVASSSLLIDVVAGETYFVEGDVTMGLRVGHPRLRQRTADKAGPAIAKLRYAVPGNSSSTPPE
jgi:hypothetical protein